METWKAAAEFTKELDDLLSITTRVDVLKERVESRKALDRMLRLVAEIADYIRNYTETATGLFYIQFYFAAQESDAFCRYFLHTRIQERNGQFQGGV